MNREQRRRFNKKHKTNFTAANFQAYELYRKLQQGTLDTKDIDPALLGSVIHIDNEEMVPEGTPVKLAYDNIKARPQNDLTDKFKEWIEEHKGQILHVTREEANSSLVCVQEDVKYVKEHFTDEDRNIGHIPWLFDIYSDFLYEHPQTHEWVHLADLPALEL